MRCARCQHESPPEAKFCAECGALLVHDCARCGARLPAGAKFCAECAHPVATPPAPQARSASPIEHTPKHLADRILSSKSALEGERKQVTVLFADLKGSMELIAARDPEEARRLLDPVLTRMIDAVHRYEGTVNQVMGDGIIALFGAPLAHEDHALRACYAALAMQADMQRFSPDARQRFGVEVRIRVGLNSGEVVVRAIGSDLHMDYTAVGQTTHLAARMEQLATPGAIVLTAETLRLVDGFVAFKSLGPTAVKGLPEPVEIFELLGAGPIKSRLAAAATRGLSPLIGRGAQLEMLHALREKAAGGRGQIVSVVGEPGVGKSRLYWEFLQTGALASWKVLSCGSVAYDKATAWLPVIHLLRAYFELDEHDTGDALAERVTARLSALGEPLRSARTEILAVFDVSVEDDAWRTLDPAQRRQRTLDGVKALLLRESQVQPLLLLVEDLHWIDSETQAVLDSLVGGLPTARVLLLVNYRPEYQHAWGGKTYYTQIRLDPLAAPSAETLLQSLLGDEAAMPQLVRLLIERTDGNPFFLEESVRSLIETGVIVGKRGVYRLGKSIADLQVPATVQAVLAARIDRLPPGDKDLLQSAAAIGKDVPLMLLVAIAEDAENELRHRLTRLQAAEFLYETSLFPEPEYTFKHALTLEVAYESLLRERRRALHERVLNALERLYADRMTEKVELLAHHAVRGEAWERATRYLYQAGEKARAQARYLAGARFFEATLDALDRLGDAADLTLKLDVCLELWGTRISTGQLQDLRELGEKAEGLARRLHDGPRLAQVQVRQAQAIVVTEAIVGTLASGIEKAREAFDHADPADLRTRSYAQFITAVACRDLGRFDEAISEFSRGMALFSGAERSKENQGLVFPIYVSLGGWRSEAHVAIGRFDEALDSATEALRMAEQIRHPSSVCIANAYLGYAHVARGDAQAAVSCLERGLVISREHDLIHGITANSLYLGYALLLLGDRERGLECLARAVEQPLGSFVLQWTRYRTVTASVYLAAGEIERAAAEVSEGLAEAVKRQARGYRAPLLRLHAEVLMGQESGNHVRAVESLNEAFALATDVGMRPEAALCQLDLGKLYRRIGKPEQAQAYLTTAATMYRAMSMRHWLEKAETEMRAL